MEARCNLFMFGGTFYERKTFIKTRVINNDSLWKQIVAHEDVEVYSVCVDGSDDEIKILCDVWNFSDKKISQGIAQMFLNSWSVVLILFDSTVTDQDKLTFLWGNFAFKGVSNVITCLKGDISDRANVTRTFKTLDDAIKQYNQQHSESLYNSIDCTDPIHYHELDLQDKDQDFKTVLRNIVSKVQQKADIKTCIERKLHNHILTLRKQNLVFCKKDGIKRISTDDEEDLNNTLTKFVQEATIIRYWENETDELICVNPILFLKMIYALHVDSCNKTFCISPSKFWSGKTKDRPEKTLLEKVIEDIPIKGLVRQSLIPLLWQDLLENKEQIELASCVLERLGLLRRYKKMSMYSDVLSLRDYPLLSAADQLSVVLMGKINDLKPSLNWNEDLQPSDVQLQLRIIFPYGYTDGCLERFLGSVQFVYKDLLNYQYGWRSGLLLRVNDVYIYFNLVEDKLELFVRTDIDIYTNTDEAIKYLWITIGPCLKCLLGYTQNWPCLLYKIIFSVAGEYFRNNHVPQSYEMKKLLFSRYYEIDEKYNGFDTEYYKMLPFTEFDPQDQHTIFRHWIDFLMKQAGSILKPVAAVSETCPTEAFLLTPEKKTLKKSKKRDISWNITETQGPSTMETQGSSTVKENTFNAASNIPQSFDRVDETEKLFGNRKCNIMVMDTNNEKPFTDEKHFEIKQISKNNNKTNDIDVKQDELSAPNYHSNCNLKNQNDVATNSSFTSCDEINSKVSDIEIANKIVEAFVSTILASGVAAFIKEESSIKGKWTKYQASIAMEMAEAIMHVNSEDVNLAAQTIINTIDKARDNEEIQGCCLQARLCKCGNNRSESSTDSKISSVCILL